MRTLRRRATLTWAMLLCALGRLALAATPATAPVDVARGDFFPLMAWDYVDDEATLTAMREAGINAVAFVRPAMLDACQRNGIRAIVFDESVAGARWDRPFDGDAAAKSAEALVRKVNNHPATWGYHLKDEPSASDYPGLAKGVAAFRRLAPGKWPYINLLPGSGASYDKDLEDFINICRPTIISYDRYVLGEDGSFGAGFWVNLAQVRDAALRHGLSFHNIVLTAAHWHYREVTEADLRLQTFGSLAYGARGLAYYKFYSGPLAILNADDLGNFRMAPLDQFGDKTPLWYSMRRVNRMITNLAGTFLKLRSDDVYHIGPGAIPDRNHGSSDRTLVKTIPDGEFVVGDFTHPDGSRYVLIVNRSLTKSAHPRADYNVPVKRLEYVSPVNGKLERFSTQNYALAPGQGVLVRITN